MVELVVQRGEKSKHENESEFLTLYVYSTRLLQAYGKKKMDTWILDKPALIFMFSFSTMLHDE